MLLAIMLLGFALLTITAMPIFVSLGLPAVIVGTGGMALKGTMTPLAYFTANDSWVILAAPFFLLSGNLMGNCGPAESLFDLCDKCLGHRRGGLAIAVIFACVLFGAVTGSAIATTIAVGSLAIGEMIDKGYEKSYCYGLCAVSGLLGLMIPPSIYMVLFAGLVNGDILLYFMSGYLPGIFLALLLILIAVKKAPKVHRTPAAMKDRLTALKKALPALGMPVLIMVSIYSGVFTPTESAALSVLYTLIICPVFYRDKFSFKTFMDACRGTVNSVGQIFIILGAVTVYSNVLTYMQVPQAIATFIAEANVSPLMLMLFIVVVYFIFGCVIDPVPIMYLTIPIFYPIIVSMGINTTYFMIVTVCMMMVAQVTPPFGVILFALSGQFKEKIEVIVKGTVPFLTVMMIGVLLIVLFPDICLILPKLLLGRY